MPYGAVSTLAAEPPSMTHAERTIVIIHDLQLSSQGGLWNVATRSSSGPRNDVGIGLDGDGCGDGKFRFFGGIGVESGEFLGLGEEFGSWGRTASHRGRTGPIGGMGHDSGEARREG